MSAEPDDLLAPADPSLDVPDTADTSPRPSAGPGGSAGFAGASRDGIVRRGRPPRRSPARVVAEYAVLAVFALALASIIRAVFGLAFYIPSESMVPTLKVNDRVLVSRVSYWRGGPARGDIVVFRNPKYDGDQPSNFLERALSNALEVVGVGQPRDKFYIKRVIGLPGDRIECRDNAVWINGVRLDEPYLPEGVEIDDYPVETVPAGHYFMMGDNRTNSQDSRYGLGTIKRSAIVGEAVVRIWPLGRAGGLDIIGPGAPTPRRCRSRPPARRCPPVPLTTGRPPPRCPPAPSPRDGRGRSRSRVRGSRRDGAGARARGQRRAPVGLPLGSAVEMSEALWQGGAMSAEDLERYEAEAELSLYREYRDVVSMFAYVVETDRRFYLANNVQLTPRSEGGRTWFELELHDAWVWDMYRPARFVSHVRVVTFKDVNVEELPRTESWDQVPRELRADG